MDEFLPDKSVADTLFKLSPPLLIMLLINVVIFLVKNFVPHKWLPVVAVALGMIITPLLVPVSAIAYTVPSPLTALVVIGAIMGYASVGFHQKFRQLFKKAGFDAGDTTEWKKGETV